MKKKLLSVLTALVLVTSCLSAVSYTHLDVYKRQAYFYVAGLYAQDPVDIAEQRLLSVYHIYYAGKQLLTFFSGESAVSASD